MKIVQINGGVFGSTGKIMFGIAEAARNQGSEVLCAAPITETNRTAQPKEPYIPIGTYHGRRWSVLLARLTGLEGHFSVFATWRLLRKIKAFSPDVVHLHSIHNSYINIPMLFRYLKRSGVRVIWTLHDCWAFTGHCPHFDGIGCQQWKTECRKCTLYRHYPKSLLDNSRYMHKKKKQWFTGLSDMTIVTPSQWLADLVGQSFLKDYPVRVVNNGIDLAVFSPTNSDFRERLHCQKKKILLGVSFVWNEKKGLDVFSQLAKQLSDDYQIVLVGADEKIRACLPENVICIPRTQDQQELAQIYSAADLFVNPTREDTYPTVNMEAIACGTPVLTFAAGGSPEIPDESTGLVVCRDDIEELINAIPSLIEAGPKIAMACEKRRKAFSMEDRFREVVALYGGLSDIDKVKT